MTLARGARTSHRSEPRAAGVLVVAHGRSGAALIRRIENSTALLAAAAGRPVLLSGIRSVTTTLDRAVLGLALRTIEYSRPEVVVEAVELPEAAAAIAERAMSVGASVVTASPALVGEAGPQLRRLASAQGVGMYADSALGFGVPVSQILHGALAGDRVRRLAGVLHCHHPPADGGDRTTGSCSTTAELAAHRSAALASIAFRTATTTADVAVDQLACHTGRAPIDSCRCAVSFCARVGDRITAEVYPSVTSGRWPSVGGRGWSSVLVVEAATAGVLVFPRCTRGLDRMLETLLGDLATALGPGDAARARRKPPGNENGGPTAVDLLSNHFLISAEAGATGRSLSLLDRLADRGVGARAGRLDERSGRVRLITDRVAEADLAIVLGELRTRRGWSVRLERPLPAKSADWSDLSPLLD